MGTPDPIPAKASQLADAIEIAEGYFEPGSLPQRINNPGDLCAGSTGLLGKGIGTQEGKTVYASYTDGRADLEHQCTAMLSGASREYSVTDTFLTVAVKYTGNDAAGDWCRHVCDKLDIDSTTTLLEFVLL